MKFLDYIFLAKINLSRRKKSVIINIILIVISLLILVISLTASKSLSTAMNKAFINNISYRSIYVTYDRTLNEKLAKEKIQNLNHINKVVSQDEYSTYVDVQKIDSNELNGGVVLLGSDSTVYPNIIKGRNFKLEEKDTCIIPINFYPFSLLNGIDDTKVLNGNELLGKYITIQYYSYDYLKPVPERKELYTKTLQVIGVYDADENKGNINECYVQYSDVLEINEIGLLGNNYSESFRPLIAIADSSVNNNIILDELDSIGYSGRLRSVLNVELVNTINFVSIMISSCLAVLAFINITITTIKSIKERNYEIGLLKAIGYKGKNILRVLCIENLIISLLSYSLVIIISILLIYLTRFTIMNSSYELEQIGISINYVAYLISFLIAIFVPLISGIFSSFKILKKSPVIINKDN